MAVNSILTEVWLVLVGVDYEGAESLVAFATEAEAESLKIECQAWQKRNGRKYDTVEPHPAARFNPELPGAMIYVDYYTVERVPFGTR